MYVSWSEIKKVNHSNGREAKKRRRIGRLNKSANQAGIVLPPPSLPFVRCRQGRGGENEMQRMHERRNATADGFNAGPKGGGWRTWSNMARQTDMRALACETSHQRSSNDMLSVPYLASRLSPPAPSSVCSVCARTLRWTREKGKKGGERSPVPIDFQPETTAQQRSPSAYASSSKASDCQAASLAVSGGARASNTPGLSAVSGFFCSGVGILRLSLSLSVASLCRLCRLSIVSLYRLDRGQRSKSRWNSAVQKEHLYTRGLEANVKVAMWT